MLKEIFHGSFENFEITRICVETMQVWLDGKSCFPHTNASNFQQLLQSLLLRDMAENSQGYHILIYSFSLH